MRVHVCVFVCVCVHVCFVLHTLEVEVKLFRPVEQLPTARLSDCLSVCPSVSLPVPWKTNPNQTVNHANLYNLFIYILNYGTGVLTTSVNFKFQHIHDWQKRVTYNSKSLAPDWKYNTILHKNPIQRINKTIATHTPNLAYSYVS